MTLNETGILLRIQALEQWQRTRPSPPTFDSGDTAWMLCATALVLLMVLPGLALFYGGMAQVKNVLSTVFQTFSITCLISILWFMISYSLALGRASPVIGGSDRFWLIGAQGADDQESPSRISTSSSVSAAPNIPETVYVMYFMTFAIITAAIVCGSFAERMKFSSMLVFILFWHILVYCFVAHFEWASDGFLAEAGTLDFAGGDVVHTCSGFSGLAASLVLGPRHGFGVKDMKPHNVVYTMIGGSLLWVGWFGFNAGSALRAGGSAGFAMMVTQISAATSGFTWMLVEWAHRGKPSVLGIVSGAVAGLVVITPAAGYVDQTGAFCMGLIGAPVIYCGMQLKHWAGYDDALDAFGVHGVGGIVGGILTGFFANDFISDDPLKRGVFYGRGIQLGLQLYGIVVVGGWSFVMSYILLKIIQATPLGLRVDEHTEAVGLDISEHGESMAIDVESIARSSAFRASLDERARNAADEVAAAVAAGKAHRVVIQPPPPPPPRLGCTNGHTHAPTLPIRPSAQPPFAAVAAAQALATLSEATESVVVARKENVDMAAISCHVELDGDGRKQTLCGVKEGPETINVPGSGVCWDLRQVPIQLPMSDFLQRTRLSPIY